MIELMSTASRLSREIAPVAGVDRAMQRDPPGDIDARTREPVNVGRVVGHQANSRAAKDLQRADGNPVVAFIIFESENAVGVERVEPCILQLISSNLVDQAEAATFLLEVKDDAAAVLREVHEC